jgi:hypothetical protein
MRDGGFAFTAKRHACIMATICPYFTYIRFRGGFGRSLFCGTAAFLPPIRTDQADRQFAYTSHSTHLLIAPAARISPCKTTIGITARKVFHEF